MVVRPAGPELELQLGGLLQVQGEFGDRGDARFDGADRFYLRRARLSTAGKFLENFDFRLELDLAGTLAKTSSLRAQLTDGYVTWKAAPVFAVRAGQFKTPFGYEQLYGDPRLVTIERSLVNDRLTVGRQLGIAGMGETGRASYALGVFNGNGPNNNFNDDSKFLVAGRLSVVLLRGSGDSSLSAGVNAYASKDSSITEPAELGFDSTPDSPASDNVFAGKRRAWGADAQARLGSLDLWIEYLATRFSPEDAIPRARLRAEGFYAQLSGFIIPLRVQLVGKFESFDPDKEASGDRSETWTIGANYLVRGDQIKLMVDELFSRVPQLPRQKKVLARLQVAF